MYLRPSSRTHFYNELRRNFVIGTKLGLRACLSGAPTQHARLLKVRRFSCLWRLRDQIAVL